MRVDDVRLPDANTAAMMYEAQVGGRLTRPILQHPFHTPEQQQQAEEYFLAINFMQILSSARNNIGQPLKDALLAFKQRVKMICAV